MTHLQFNLDIELLKEKVMNSEMDSVIKSAVVLTLNAYMEHERDKHLHVAHYERSPERQDSRNGYYERELTMKLVKSLSKYRALALENFRLRYLKNMLDAIKHLFFLCLRWWSMGFPHEK